jgi:hypothetical protein
MGGILKMIHGQGMADAESFDPDLDAWDAWRPEEVAARLAGVPPPWYVAGGWALDLFLGYQRRPHEDIEIGVLHGRFDQIVAALIGYEFFWLLMTEFGRSPRLVTCWTGTTRRGCASRRAVAGGSISSANRPQAISGFAVATRASNCPMSD